MRPRPERVLLLCYYDEAGIATPIENIAELQRGSRFALEVLNLFGGELPFRLPADFPITDYDAVVIHNTIAYTIDNVAVIDEQLSTTLSEFAGVKVLFKQDEQYRADRVARFIGEKSIDLVFTCLPEEAIEVVYPSMLTGAVEYRRMFTGYITEEMRAYDFSNDSRPIDVGYRGSVQPLYFGRLAYEKREIGDLFVEKAKGRGLMLDVSSALETRFTGSRWIQFLGSCKATLGTESGASIFDLDGRLESYYAELIRQYGEHPESPEWCEEILEKLAPYEGLVSYAQVSPRHFEAAATRTVQILYEGAYSGIFMPGRHFVPLKKDFSNFEEVIDSIRDPRVRSLLTDAAYEEIVCNKEFWSENFAAQFDAALSKQMERKNVSKVTRFCSSKTTKKNALLICAHVPQRDPRISWIADYAPEAYQVNVLGAHDKADAPPFLVTSRSNSGLEIQAYRRMPRKLTFEALTVEDCGYGDIGRNPGLLALNMISSLGRMNDDEATALLGGHSAKDRIPSLRWYWEYLLNTTNALVRAGTAISSIDLLIAADLDSLLAAAILKRRLKIPLIYDAHEYWPEADPFATRWEVGFWRSLEAMLLPETDARFTVSPPLARFMSETYGFPFVALPNAEPYAPPSGRRPGNNGASVVFLFQGGFAKGRGLELLIKHWQYTSPQAELHLRGPRWEYTDALQALAKDCGLLDTRIKFLDAVDESQLVEAAASASVGIIPYEPHGANNRACCPNKLSQYAAAGLPIFGNDTEFVRQIVLENEIGRVVDFRDRNAFVAAVNAFVENSQERERQGLRARSFYEQKFNWQTIGKPMYEAFEAVLNPSFRNTSRSFEAASADFIQSSVLETSAHAEHATVVSNEGSPVETHDSAFTDPANAEDGVIGVGEGTAIAFEIGANAFESPSVPNENAGGMLRASFGNLLRALASTLLVLSSVAWRNMPVMVRGWLMPLANRVRRALVHPCK